MPRLVACSLFVLCLVVVPAIAQDDLYDNGPTNGTVDAWNVANGFAVSDSFMLNTASTVNGLSFSVWLFPGDVLYGVEVQITSSEFGGTTYTDQMINLTASGCVINQFGFNVCNETGSFTDPVNLARGSYWLTLLNGNLPDDPAYWDENSGPSRASESSVGTIPSESFTLEGSPIETTTTTTTGTTAEPSSVMLFGSGVLGLAGMIRRRLL